MDEIAVEYDWDHIKKLIDVVDALRGHPNLKPLQDAALIELGHLANPPLEEVEHDEEQVDDEDHHGKGKADE